MRRIFTILFVLLIANLYSQSVSFEATGPGAVSLNDRFYLKYTINANGNNFVAPNLSDFNILSGPNQSQSQSFSYVNGKSTRSITITLTYILAPKKAGKFIINPAKINIGGKTYKSNTVSISVVKGNAKSTSNNSGNSNQNNNNSSGAVSKDKIYVSIITNKRTLYKGEQLTATVKIFTKYDIAGFEDIKFPSWNGFFTQEIPTSDQVSLKRENINGQIYYTAVLQKMILQPQKTGTITIEPAKFDIIILKQGQKKQRRSIFDDFFNSGYQKYRVSVKSKPIKIKVKALPNASEDFDGAVGTFKFAASIDKTSVSVNDAISSKVKVLGSGNLKLINEPDVNLPPDFELFDDAKVTDRIKNTSAGANGSRTFEYIFSPRHSGTYKIPPISFVYFDPSLKKYKTIKSKEFLINVEKGNGDTSQVTRIVRGTTKEDIKYLGKDIRFIKTGKLKLKERGKYLYGSNFYMTVYLLSLLLFIILFIVKRKHIKDSADVNLMKNKKANKMAKKHLKNASLSLKENDKNKFYDDIAKALWGYIADKLNISGTELNKENIESTLLSHNADTELVNEFIELLDTCEFERYAPSSKEDRLNEIYKSAETLIGKFERIIKKIRS